MSICDPPDFSVDELSISLRAFAKSSNRLGQSIEPDRAAKLKPRRKRVRPVPSPWVLAFDTETTTDASQALRFGSYQVRNCGELREAGLFFDDSLSAEEAAISARTSARSR